MTTEALSYQNIISYFFVNGQMINNRNERIENGVHFVLDNVPNSGELSQRLQGVIRKKVASVETTFLKRYRASESKDEFEKRYETWIRLHLKLPSSIIAPTLNRQRGSTQKKKLFGELSDRQKNRRADELSGCGVDQLLLAATKAAEHSNDVDLHYVLKFLCNNPDKASHIRTLLSK